MKLRQLTRESEILEPIGLDELRSQARIEHNDEDALLLLLISAARAHAEQYIDAPIATRSYELSLDCVTTNIELPISPVAEDSIQINYADGNGDEQTFTDFESECYLFSSKITLNSIPAQAITIRFNAGLEPHFGEVPANVKLAILMIAATAYDQPEDHTAGVKLSAVPMPSQVWLNPFKRMVV